MERRIRNFVVSSISWIFTTYLFDYSLYLFKNEEIFSGQEKEGFVIFPALHSDVRDINVTVHDCVLRFDYRNEPVEAVNIIYGFERDIGRKYGDAEPVIETASK